MINKIFKIILYILLLSFALTMLIMGGFKVFPLLTLGCIIALGIDWFKNI